MKTNLIKVVLVAAMVGTTGLVAAKSDSEYVAADNNIESQLCAAAATSNTQRMNAKLAVAFSNQKLSKKYELIANNLECNGM